MFLHIMKSHVATIQYPMHYPIYGLYRWSCNLLNIISVYSLNLGKLPGRFSYKWPGYEATPRLNGVQHLEHPGILIAMYLDVDHDDTTFFSSFVELFLTS